ncbi:DUF2784 domain-containing protein [Nocardia nova]|uniref:DUF2784 domain-containing protein n=1 Tax=Nocardia nova TaxID=37330 RepID=UPI0026DA5E35
MRTSILYGPNRQTAPGRPWETKSFTRGHRASAPEPAHAGDERLNLDYVMYRLLADATAGVHFLFIAYLVVGGFVAWRWRWTIWTHIAAVAWGFSTVLFGVDCPLTYLETWARERGGEAGLPPTGFIAHYLTGVLYPRSALDLVRVLVVVLVAVSWIGYIRLGRRRRYRSRHAIAE